MIIEHNKKVKLNNPTPYPSGSKTKPNPTLGKPTPATQQVHQHSQDEPTGESKHQTPSESLTALNNFKKGTKRDDSATWIPLTPQVQYQPLSKLPVMTHPTPNVLIA